jgi:glycosyltransferase involved in cell wall biosynthesis
MMFSPQSVVIRSTSGVFEPRFQAAKNFLNELNLGVLAITWSRTVREGQITDSNDEWVFTDQASYGSGYRNYFSHLKFMFFAYSSLKRIDPKLVYACDLDTLIPTLLWGRKKTYVLIFDQFDPLSARSGNRIISNLLNRLEIALSKEANFRITPNINRIQMRHSCQWIEIKNLFEIESSDSSDSLLPDCLRLFYGGIISKDRGLFALADGIVATPKWEFQIFGQGPELIRLQSFNNPRIKLMGLIEHKQLMNEARNADLYAALYDPSFNNNRKTASNKLFEAAQLGIPLLATKNTFLGDVVEKYGLGWTVHYDNNQEIINVLANFGNMGDREKAEIKKNLQDYFVVQLLAKRESLNTLKDEIKRALEK